MDGIPATLHGKPEAIIIFNNLPDILGEEAPMTQEECAALALEIDQTVRSKAPAGWKGDEAKERVVQNFLHRILRHKAVAARPPCHPGPLRHHQKPTRILMTETFNFGDVTIDVTRKDIKNVHLSVHPPDGRVTLAAPLATRLEVARAYALFKLDWIRDQQQKLANQARESPRRFVTRETLANNF